MVDEIAIAGGGLIGSAVGFGDVSGFNLKSMGLAILGAVILLFGYRMLKKQN